MRSTITGFSQPHFGLRPSTGSRLAGLAAMLALAATGCASNGDTFQPNPANPSAPPTSQVTASPTEVAPTPLFPPDETPDAQVSDTATPNADSTPVAPSETATPASTPEPTQAAPTESVSSQPCSTCDGEATFIAYGDAGSGDGKQNAIARQMVRTYNQTPFTDAITLGDNVYPDGDVMRKGDQVFTRPYAPLVSNGVKFHISLGNHDKHHHADEVKFFQMPGAYYQTKVGPVDVFMLDTNNFAHEPAQQEWLRQALAQSTSRLKIVAGHYPMYTSGYHQKDSEIPDMKRTLEPIMKEGGATLYLCGHDHDYERFKPVNGITEVLSGGGGAELRSFSKILPQSAARAVENNFMLFHYKDGVLTGQSINPQGKVIDQFTMTVPG